MKKTIVYIESIENSGFQFIEFDTESKALLFIKSLHTKSKTLRAIIWKY